MSNQLFNLFGSISVDLSDFNNALDEVNQGAQNIQQSMESVGSGMQNAGAGLTAGLTVPIAGIGIAAIDAAKQADNAFAMLKNATGSTVEMTEELVETARNVYKDGYGESLEEVSQALVQVKNNIHGLSEADLDFVTKSAMNLAKVFETDINQVTRAGNNLMEAFGVTSKQAFDAMAHGAQNGLNFSDEMFDNLAEYSGLWGNMGYSMEEMFGVLQRGSAEGVYNLDYLNDIMKEMQIRLKDGSTGVADAMAQLSTDTQNVWAEYLKGEATVKDVTTAVASELKAMDDQVLATQLGVSLFGR